MKRILWIILCYMKISTIICHYYESVTVVPSSGIRTDSYFGYSMAFLGKDLVISAPRADNIGHIYHYKTDTKSANKVDFNLKRVDGHFKQDYWLGATVRKGSSFVVTCAPRTTNGGTVYKFVSGTCYTYSVDGNKLRLPDGDHRADIYNGNMDSFGWSIDVDKLNRISIGSPILVGGYVKFHQTTFTTPYVLTNTTDTFNFGYAIASGFFLSNISQEYAVTSTYGDHGEGQVFIFNLSYKEIYRISNDEVGSTFGAALCSLRLTGHRSSLLVGAPTYSIKRHEYDHGAVYLYTPNFHDKSVKGLMLKRTIKGTSSGGYFGYAITNIGDIDNDNMDDVAIGAPFEDDGKGAVYIYSGYGLVSDKSWLQKLHAEVFRSFGFSIAPSTASDNEACNGLAVSAPFDNSVVLFECIASITTELRLESTNLQNREDKNYFEMKACIDVKYPHKPVTINTEIVLKTQLIHPHAKIENAEADGVVLSYFQLFERLPSYCQTFFVLTPKEGDYDTIIKYNLSIGLEDVATTEEHTDQVVLSDRSVRSLEGELWAADCHKTFGRCVPELSFQSSTTFSDPYIVSSMQSESYSFVVTNVGEIAYNPCAIVTFHGANVLTIPISCSRVDNMERIICKPSTYLKTNLTWGVEDIMIETSFATNILEELVIGVDLYNNCNNRDDKTSYTEKFNLIYDVSGITIQGLANPSKDINITSVDFATGKQLQHFYSIRNDGPTDYINAKIDILLEKREYLGYLPLEVTCNCSLVSTEDMGDTTKYTYQVEKLHKQNETKVYICLNIPPDTLGNFIKNDNITITSTLTLHLKEKIKEKRVTTTLTLQSATVATWIIIIAALMALLILILLIFILRECGFFQRKNKKKLKRLKTIVQRESTRRASGERPQHGDTQRYSRLDGQTQQCNF